VKIKKQEQFMSISQPEKGLEEAFLAFLNAFLASPDEVLKELRETAEDFFKEAEKIQQSGSISNISKFRTEKDNIIKKRFYESIKNTYTQDSNHQDFLGLIINTLAKNMGITVNRYQIKTLTEVREFCLYQVIFKDFLEYPYGKTLQAKYSIEPNDLVKKCEKLTNFMIDVDVLLILILLFLVATKLWKFEDFYEIILNNRKKHDKRHAGELAHGYKAPGETPVSAMKKYSLILILGGDAPGLEQKTISVADVFDKLDEYFERYHVAENGGDITPPPYENGHTPMYWLQIEISADSKPHFMFIDQVETFMESKRECVFNIHKVSFEKIIVKCFSKV